MKPIVVRNVAIGQGRPKICVPIVAAAAEDILQAAENMQSLPVDIVEWRADWYKDAQILKRFLSWQKESERRWEKNHFYSLSGQPGRAERSCFRHRSTRN